MKKSTLLTLGIIGAVAVWYFFLRKTPPKFANVGSIGSASASPTQANDAFNKTANYLAGLNSLLNGANKSAGAGGSGAAGGIGSGSKIDLSGLLNKLFGGSSSGGNKVTTGSNANVPNAVPSGESGVVSQPTGLNTSESVLAPPGTYPTIGITDSVPTYYNYDASTAAALYGGASDSGFIASQGTSDSVFNDAGAGTSGEDQAAAAAVGDPGAAGD